MVSLETANLSTKERNINWFSTIFGDQSKKRKRDQDDQEEKEEDVQTAAMELKLWCSNKKATPPPPPAVHIDDIKLNLEDSPLPPEWQRCLDIKSGLIHFYNTRTRKRTTRDPRRSPEPPSSRPTISLDLELNLGCESPPFNDNNKGGGGENQQQGHEKKLQLDESRSDLDHLQADVDRTEMMAAVCLRCHMLVMMCSSAPSCPNCKFLHPTTSERTAPAPAPAKKDSVKSGFRLLSCKER